MPKCISLQPYYNLYDRERFETNLESLCLQEGVGVISYFSLAKGFLTGKYRNPADLGKSVRGCTLSHYLNERGFKILDALEEIAIRHHTVPASIALAWLLHRKSITAPIVSATSVMQLNELVKAAELVLSKSDIAKLDDASSYGALN